MMKKIRSPWLIFALASASLAVACGDASSRNALMNGSVDALPMSSSKSTKSPAATPSLAAAPAAEAEKAVPVETVTVEPQRVEEEVQITGELRANEEVQLRAETSGRVVEIGFQEGQKVATGDLLVKINDADLQADLRRVAVQHQLAQQREQRTAVLLEERTVSQEVYDEARGRLRVIEAEVELIEAKIAKTEVRAPFAGVVGLRAVSVGSYLTSDQVIATLQNLDPIKVDFAVPEKYAARLQAGDAIEFSVAGSDDAYAGKVYAVEPRVEAETRTVQVRARAQNADRRLVPGAFAEVRLVLDRREDALMVPAIALVPGLEATTVYVVENGRAATRKVRVGKRTAEDVQIVEGLEAGDQVVVSGVQQMRPGVLVDALR